MRPKSIGPKLLRRWRQQQTPAVTMADVGRAIGFKNGSYIQKYEKGQRSLPIERLLLLSQHTGIPVEELACKEQVSLLRRAAAVLGAHPGSAA